MLKELTRTEIPSVGDLRKAYDVKESARLLSCSPGLIRKFIRQGRLARIPGVRKILVPASELESFVSSVTTICS
jgi:hypothetical protein